MRILLMVTNNKFELREFMNHEGPITICGISVLDLDLRYLYRFPIPLPLSSLNKTQVIFKITQWGEIHSEGVKCGPRIQWKLTETDSRRLHH